MSNATPPAPGRAEGLLPCPFCGGEAALFEHIGPPRHNYWFVNCLACDSDGAGKKDEAEAIAAWNRRPAPAIVAEVGEVRRYVLGWQQESFGKPEPAMVAGHWSPDKVTYVLSRDYDAALRTLAEVREKVGEFINCAFVGDGPTYSCLLCGQLGTDHPKYLASVCESRLRDINQLNDQQQAFRQQLAAATQRAEQAEAAREALLVRFEKACGENTAKESRIIDLEDALSEALKSHDDPSYLRDNGRQRAPNEWRALLAALPAPATNATGSSHEQT